jgi:hypothetical protein
MSGFSFYIHSSKPTTRGKQHHDIPSLRLPQPAAYPHSRQAYIEELDALFGPFGWTEVPMSNDETDNT